MSLTRELLQERLLSVGASAQPQPCGGGARYPLVLITGDTR